MKGALLGAGLGAGFNMMRGKDPLQGAMLGGLGGGLASGASGYLASGATGPMAKAGASMMMNPVASPSLAGGGLLSNMMAGNTPLDKMISTGFEKGMGLLNDSTGLTKQDLGQIALGQGISALTPEKQQAINHQVGQIKEANYPVAQAPAGNLNVLGPQEAETVGLGTDPELIQKTLYEDPRYRRQRRIGQ